MKRETGRQPSRDGSGILFCLVLRRDKKDRADSATDGIRLQNIEASDHLFDQKNPDSSE